MNVPRAALLSLLALVAVPAALQAQALVGMYPAGVGLDSGRRATIPIVISAGGVSVGSYQLQVTWDSSVVRFVSAAPGAFGAPTVNAAGAATGSLTLAGANPIGAAGLFSIAELTFEMRLRAGSSPVTVVSPALTAATTFAPIGAAGSSGTICASSGAFGDVNRDGSVLSNDALLVVTAAVGLPITPFTLVNADVDGDGDADTRDALGILSAAVGLASFPRVGQTNAPCAGAPAATLVLTPGSALLAPGDALPIAAQARDTAGNPTAAASLIWSSDATGVATVDSTGRVSAVGNGSATITAQAIGVSQIVTVTVQPRHTWFVEQSIAAQNTVHLGSAAFPFATIQQGVDAAAPGDTVRVGNSPPYGPVTITSPVVLLGDSSATGMPTITNAGGPAIAVGSSGLVVIRRFRLLESNSGIEAGLVAPGDSLEVQSVVASSMRGPGFRVRNMRRAVALGVSGNGLALAGFLAETTAAVVVDGADFRAVAPGSYPGVEGPVSIGVAAVVGDSLRASRVTVFGALSERSIALGASFVQRVELSQFDLGAAGPIKVDSARYVAVSNGVAQGLREGILISADTAIVTNVSLRTSLDGVRIRQRNPAAPTPGSLVRVARSRVDSISFGHGLTVTGIDRVIVDSTTVENILNGAGILVGSSSSLTLRADTLRSIADEALRADSVGILSLVRVHVTGSAQPSFKRFGSSIFAVTILHADSVRLDSIAVVDNSGGGVLLDSARVVNGDATTIVRNLGLRAGLCEFGCDVLPSPPPSGSTRSQGLYQTTQAPGLVLSAVQTTRLDRFVVDSNPFGAIDAALAVPTNPTLIIQGGRIGGGLYAIRATGDVNAPSGQVSVDGVRFGNAEAGISATHFTDFSLTRARLDSIPYRQSNVGVLVSDVANVSLADDTLAEGLDAGIRVDQANLVDIRRVTIRGFRDSCGECGDFALSLNGIQTSALVYGGRLEQNEISGASFNSGSATFTFDSMVVLGHFGRGLQMTVPTTVRQSLFQGNGTGIGVFTGGESSAIQNNNFIGNGSALTNGTAVLDAPNNWWNDPLGPSGCSACNIASTGDPVSENVIFTPVLSAPYGAAPLPAPRRVSRVRP
jgi:hypothetical protein